MSDTTTYGRLANKGPRPRLRTRSELRLLPQLEQDAVKALEWMIASRNFHRQGDVIEMPITIGYMQRALKRSGAKRKGRDHARSCLAALVEMSDITDTGRVAKPRKQPSLHHSYWWRLFRINAVARAKQPLGAYSSSKPQSPSAPYVIASLCRFLGFKQPGSLWSKPEKGSARAAFLALGPP